MKKTSALLVGLSLFALSPAAQAEGFYGSGSFGLTNDNTWSSGGRINEAGTDASGFVGYRFATGLFVEGELRFRNLNDDSEAFLDNLNHSRLAMLRAGLERGNWTAELTYGAVETSGGTGATGLTIGGIGASYALSDTVRLRGSLSHMAGASGEEAEDVLRDATIASLGLAFAPNDRLTLWGDAVYGDGSIDSDRDMGLVTEVSLGADYAVGGVEGLRAFGSVTYTDVFQNDEGDRANAVRVSLGLTYSFGAAGSRETQKRGPVLGYESWMALSTEVVE